MTHTIFTDVGEFENRLGLPVDFYKHLLEEDDWSFVIKLNTLFECACTHVLVTRLGTPELADALAHLDLANTKYGKVRLLRSLGAISPEQAAILRCLAELRNTLVHNITDVGFSFATYVATRDANQLKAMTKNFGQGLQDTIEIAEKRVPREQFVRENPKVSLWLTAAELIACLYLECEVAQLRLEKLALAEYNKLATTKAGMGKNIVKK